MKKLLAVFYIVIFFVGCSKEQGTEKVIPSDKFYNLLIDMHLADASLEHTYNTDTLLMKAKSKYNYVFDKHDTDSAQFVYNLNHYTRNKSKELANIYKNIVDSLERFREEITKTKVPFSVPLQSTYPDSIYLDLKIPYKIDSLTLKRLSDNKIKDTLKTVNITAATDTIKNDSVATTSRRKGFRKLSQ